MAKGWSPGIRVGIIMAASVSLVASVLLTNLIPPVVGLGETVRLPIYHGASTWVNLGALSLLGGFAVAYLALGLRELYRWAVGFRLIGATMWLINTVLGALAAMKTWDFTGSADNPIVIAQSDPRLLVQLQLALLLVALLIAGRLLESDRWRALLDVGLVGVMWYLLGSVLTSPQARALHPENPVMNSGPEIQMPFFAILATLSLGVILLVSLVRDRMVKSDMLADADSRATTIR